MVLGRFRVSAVPVVICLAVTVLVVSGCSDTWTDIKRGLGMEKVVPDAFEVTTNAPLAIPPDYTLRPPRPGAAPTQQVSPTQQAQNTVFRIGDNKLETLPPDKSRSRGETALLKDAGAQNVPKNIRRLVSNDERKAADSDTLTDRLLFWRSEPPNPNQELNPAEEAARLREYGATGGSALAANQPATTAVNAGPKPTIERANKDSGKGFFGWLF